MKEKNKDELKKNRISLIKYLLKQKCENNVSLDIFKMYQDNEIVVDEFNESISLYMSEIVKQYNIVETMFDAHCKFEFVKKVTKVYQEVSEQYKEVEKSERNYTEVYTEVKKRFDDELTRLQTIKEYLFELSSNTEGH